MIRQQYNNFPNYFNLNNKDVSVVILKQGLYKINAKIINKDINNKEINDAYLLIKLLYQVKKLRIETSKTKKEDSYSIQDVNLEYNVSLNANDIVSLIIEDGDNDGRVWRDIRNYNNVNRQKNKDIYLPEYSLSIILIS